jgi:L-alanine-DL-glutamate epimerase-like enolase superfamily enzyme
MPVPIEGGRVEVCTVPTERPESDGTIDWDSTTIVLVRLRTREHEGIGYTYGDGALGPLLERRFLPKLKGHDALRPGAGSALAYHEARNIGRPGAVMMAISALDVALYDLKAKILRLPLADLLGRQRDRVPAYWSAGFTSYSADELREEFHRERERGFTRFKMKVGTRPVDDPERVRVARSAIGDRPELYVDANGAYGVEEALRLAGEFARSGVTWFEEPVPAEDLVGLRRVRDRLPPGMELATGEYGWGPEYFRRVLETGSTDVLQIDATRCGGVSGWVAASALAMSYHIPVSSHTAPSLHAHLGAATPGSFRHLEFFKDHARLERMLFDGCPDPHQGSITPSADRPGLGLSPREDEIARYRG